MKKILAVATLALAIVSVANFAQAQATRKVDSAYCIISPTGQKILGRDFFSKVHNVSQQNPGVCVVAKIFSEQSGRVYLNGARLAKSAGSLSNREVKEIENAYRCTSMTYTCIETNF